METLVSAVLGDLISRAISAVVKKCGEQATAKEQTTTEEDLQRLQQLLLRISTVVEEAEGRCITNRGMIRQVSMMWEQMIRGHYLLDSFKCTKNTNDDDDEVSRPSYAQSKFNPAKRFRRLSSNNHIESMVIGRVNNNELKQVILVLENMVSDMNEFAIFLPTYPRLRRQPYGAYLYLDKYMFGRQMEREQAVSFLLQAEPNGNLGVLPIVGPGRIGKSTFVEHICDDERVRNHFSLIFLYSGNGLKDETATTFRDHCVIKHRNIASGEERCLAVIELVGDNVDEEAWKRLLRSCERSMTPGSKIIITSRSEKTAASLGTTGALRLNYLSKEAYWYFFRMLLFGSTDPEEHPRLTSIAMEMARELCGSFILAYDVAALLRENLSALFWGRVLRHLREQRQRNIMLLGEYCLEGGRPRYVWSMPNTRRGPGDISFFLLYDDCQKGPAAYGEVPRIRVLDLLSGTWSATPRGKFEVFCCRSLIPPYYMYTAHCEFVQPERRITA
uniref:Uncharacterized protein n=1 Tax=Avena sativa TaxID=4498 RepID=A0ACD5U137_AVESA